MKTYHIFGRKAYAEPLTFVQQIQAETEKDLDQAVDALKREPDWVELVAIAESDMIEVLFEGAEA
ncbi:MAG: hypothetical protein Q9P14_10745 [candidate division KSB1 bacterium]|nr:hypothetical protein [candidate division KSB1 bacterium]MDQ7063210.1 hypothetical protein [candidate division KSB1 bacterium]